MILRTTPLDLDIEEMLKYIGKSNPNQVRFYLQARGVQFNILAQPGYAILRNVTLVEQGVVLSLEVTYAPFKTSFSQPIPSDVRLESIEY